MVDKNTTRASGQMASGLREWWRTEADMDCNSIKLKFKETGQDTSVVVSCHQPQMPLIALILLLHDNKCWSHPVGSHLGLWLILCSPQHDTANCRKHLASFLNRCWHRYLFPVHIRHSLNPFFLNSWKVLFLSTAVVSIFYKWLIVCQEIVLPNHPSVAGPFSLTN